MKRMDMTQERLDFRPLPSLEARSILLLSFPCDPSLRFSVFLTDATNPIVPACGGKVSLFGRDDLLFMCQTSGFSNQETFLECLA